MVLDEKDVNTTVEQRQEKQQGTEDKGKEKDVKSMEYHRQKLQDKMEAERTQQYVSPSDNIMSPCTAKINALRNKTVSKAKPRSLFAQASAKKFVGDNPLGARPIEKKKTP